MTAVANPEQRAETVPGIAPDARGLGLAAKAQALRSRRGSRSFDRWLLTVGALLLPLGLVLVVLGWQGAAHTPLVFEQIPYLLSGGILGLALVFVGGFIYFGYWQSVLVRDTRAQHRELTEAFGRIEALLAHGAGGTTTISHPGGLGAGGFVATQAGSMIHRADCPVVVGRDKLRAIPANSAESSALLPCRICEPLSTS